MLKHQIAKLADGKDLTNEETVSAMDAIMDGRAGDAQMAAFLTALRMKGESIDEITACAQVMRDKALTISPNVPFCVDIVGTGGDCSGTINVSTAASFAASAAGACIAKHGNRAVSSTSGAADVLEALGVNIMLDADGVKRLIEELGLGFMFAQTFHRSMKNVAGVRSALGIRTVFNLLGPLTNPAKAPGEVMGIFDGALTEPVARVMLNLGLEHAMVVYGAGGMDEISVCGPTRVSEAKDGEVKTYEITPEQFGINRADISEVRGGTAEQNAEEIRRILSGERGPKFDIVALNAGAAIYVGKAASSMEEGVQKAIEVMTNGAAYDKLTRFAEMSQSLKA